MNWKTEAIEKLCCYDAMCQSVINLPDEIRRLAQEYDDIYNRKPEKQSKRKKKGETREDALLSNLVKQEELGRSLEQTRQWLRIVERALSALNPEERLVLNRFYICPERGGVDRLCQELQVEQSSIYRKRDKALRKFTVALYGVAES